MRKQVLLFFLFISFSLFSQEKVVLHGKITNDKDVEGIHILNTSSRYNSITDAYGNFAITVKTQDSLVFSSVNYSPKTVVITPEIFEKELLIVTLSEFINELDEVVLGNELTGNIKTDLEKIPVKDQINFDDVGIPGFKGKAEEKIPRMLGQVITPLSVNLEGLYKHLSGYYRKLRLQRKWEVQNITVARMLEHFSVEFFKEAYDLPDDRLYDFLLFCIETTDIQQDFGNENFGQVVALFETKAPEYLDRLPEKKE